MDTCSGYCSDLTQGEFGGQEGKALLERVEVLGRPSSKERSQAHARLGALGTARAATDFARNDQRANTALGQIVVGRNPRHRHEDEEFA